MISRPLSRPDDTHRLDFSSQPRNNQAGTAGLITACDRCSPIGTDNLNQNGGRLRIPAKRYRREITVEEQVKFARLRRFNLIMGFLHAIQGVMVLVLANSFALPVISYSSLPQLTGSSPRRVSTAGMWRT
jgi:hypothetical protein